MKNPKPSLGRPKLGLGQNWEVGRAGEEVAKKYLEDKGYKIIEQNYRTKYAEIDLVAQRDNVLILVEVRTKTDEKFGAPEETINKRKMRKLQMSALAYTSRIKWQGRYQIDAICLILDKNNNSKRLNHYENIC